jgi:hypothetical protein
VFSPTEVFRIIKPVTNTLAYLANAKITVVKSFWALGPGKVDFLVGETVIGAHDFDTNKRVANEQFGKGSLPLCKIS